MILRNAARGRVALRGRDATKLSKNAPNSWRGSVYSAGKRADLRLLVRVDSSKLRRINNELDRDVAGRAAKRRGEALSSLQPLVAQAVDG